MKNNSLKSKWNQLVGDIKRKWSKLTDDDLKRVEGDTDKLAGILQEKYGYKKEEALSEVEKWVDSIK